MIGIHNIPATTYHADPCPTPSLSNSVADTLITRSPLHAWHQHPRLNPNFEPETDSKFDYGSAAHALLLERDESKLEIVNARDWKTNAARELRDQARAEGRFPILAHQFGRISSMVRAATEFIETTELSGIFATGMPERTAIWQEGSIWCRCRPDLMADVVGHISARTIVLDYKSTENSEPEAFIRQIARMNYDLQAEWYTRGIKAVTGIEPVFVFLAQEITPPYACSLIALSNAYRAIGQAKVEKAIGMWQRCMALNEWRSYSTRIAYAEPPAWSLAQLDEHEKMESEDE